jgi:hypothetical protein
MNPQQLFNTLTDLRTEGCAIEIIKMSIISGYSRFKKHVEEQNRKLEYIERFIFKCNIHLRNTHIDWPIYPFNYDPTKKAIGKPYKDRIKSSFEDLQRVVDEWSYILYKFFGTYIYDEKWENQITICLMVICKAYEEERPDPYGFREGLIINEPDENDLPHIGNKVLAYALRYKDENK